MDSQDISLLSRDQLVDKMIRDMYLGNGKPALTVRVATVEENLSDIKSMLHKGLWLLAGTFITALLELLKVIK